MITSLSLNPASILLTANGFTELFRPAIETFIRLNIAYIVPEAVMAIGLLLVLFLTVLSHNKNRVENNLLMAVSFLTVCVSLGLLIGSVLNGDKTGVGTITQTAFYGSLAMDKMACLMRGLILLGSGVTIMISHYFLCRTTRVIGDYYVLILGASLGTMILASANDLVTLFVGLETLSIPSYILAGYIRKNRVTAEAAFKYLIYGSAASGILLFAFSLLYGLAGTTAIPEIANVLMNLKGVNHPMLAITVVMITVALGFKLSLAPFHMWTPDVYDGAPTPVAAFLSVVSKTAAFAMAMRVFLVLLEGQSFYWLQLVLLLSVTSMLFGNLVALRQTHMKRLLAYSTIAHAGYMMLAFLAPDVNGMSSLVYYLITYVFMNIGTFAAVIYLNGLLGRDDIASLAGLVRKCPGLTFFLTICLLSLAGIPITSGFFAKFFIFQALAAEGPHTFGLIIFALINSTISLYYYVRVIRTMIVDEPSEAVLAIQPEAMTSSGARPLLAGLATCVALTLVLGVFASQVYEKIIIEPVTQLQQVQKLTSMKRLAPKPQVAASEHTLASH